MYEQYQEYIDLIGPTSFSILLTVLIVWSIIWKGIALWRAARNSHKIWYFVLLIVNTVGILEIIYIFFFSKKRTNLSNNPTNY